MKRTSLLEYFEEFDRWGSGIAYVHRRGYRHERWSYREVVETARQFARELEARQVHAGERVLIWGDNCAEWVCAFFGCLLRGAVVVPMDHVAAPDFALRVARQVEAKLLVLARAHQAQAAGFPTFTLETLRDQVSRHQRAPYPAPPMRRQDQVQIVFTSGTTADPKGVVITHGNVLANLEPFEGEIARYRKYERIFHPIRFLNLLPLSHVFGQFLGMFIPQLIGGTVVFHDSLSPGEVLRAIRREKVSALVAVPRMLQSLTNKIQADWGELGQGQRFAEQLDQAANDGVLRRWWRFRRIHRRLGWKFWAVISGGATLDSATEDFWRRLGFAVIQGYGLTETTSLISVNHPFKLSQGSIGKVLPGRELKLDNSGEILVRGEGVASGYWQGRKVAPVAGEQEDGWFHTGDTGELDAEGNLYFKGRTKNVIVTPEGMNVYPEDLEAALRRQPEVADCLVIGLPRNGNAEPCAVLILREASSTATAEAVVRRANQSLAEYQRMRLWFVWPEQDFPRTTTLKPRAGLVLETVQARLGHEREVSAAMDGGIGDLLARVTGRRPAGLTPDAALEHDLNLSSLDRVELLCAIEDRYQVDLDEASLTAATTVRELERLLQQPQRPRAFGAGYDYPRWPQRWPVTWIRLAFYYLLTRPATLMMAWPRVTGRNHLRDLRGPVLVVSNHVTYVDVGFVLAALPPRLRHRLAVAMSAETLWEMRQPPPHLNFFRRILERLSYFLVVALFNVFPLPQKTGFRESFEFAGESADRGYSVLVFPEGQRTQDGRLSPFRSGIGLLVDRLRLPVVPMRIDGLFELKRRRRRFSRPGTVQVKIGEPVRFPPESDPGEIAGDLERRVAALE